MVVVAISRSTKDCGHNNVVSQDEMFADMQHREAMSADGRDHACVLFPWTSQGSVWLGSPVATIPEKRRSAGEGQKLGTFT